MKTLFLLCSIVFQTNTYSQSKQEDEKAFIAELNKIIKNTKEENEGFKFEGKRVLNKSLLLIRNEFYN